MWEMDLSGMMPRFWLSFSRTSLLGIRGNRSEEKERKYKKKRSICVCVGL